MFTTTETQSILLLFLISDAYVSFTFSALEDVGLAASTRRAYHAAFNLDTILRLYLGRSHASESQAAPRSEP